MKKFLGGVGYGSGTNEFNFGDDPDHRPDPVVRRPKSAFTGLSKKLPTDFVVNTHRTDALQKSFSNSILLAFAGGLCSLTFLVHRPEYF